MLPVNRKYRTHINYRLRSIRVIGWASVLCFSFLLKDVAAGTNSLPVIWKTELQKGDYDLNGVVLGKDRIDERLLVAGVRSAHADPKSSQGFYLWALDQNGKLIRETKINLPLHGERVPGLYPYVVGGSVCQDGSLLLIAEPEEEKPALVKVSMDGEILFMRSIQEILATDREVTIRKMIPSTDGRFILVGEESGHALAMEVDTVGKLYWRRIFDTNGWGTFRDVLLVADTLIFAGEVTKRNESRPFVNVLLVQCDRTGGLQSQTNFPGCNTSLCEGGGKYFGLVYARNNPSEQDLRLRIMGMNFLEVWETQIPGQAFGTGECQVAHTTDGGYLVAGIQSLQLTIWSVDADGGVRWTESARADDKRTWRVNAFTPYREGIVFFYPLVGLTKERTPKYSIGLLNLKR